MFCKYCGTEIPRDQNVCPGCGASQDAPAANSASITPTASEVSAVSPELAQSENVGMGILGALLAAVVGGAVVALFTKLGYISSVGGIILAFLTVWLYKKFSGGTIGTAGVVICIVLCIIMPYLGYRAGFAWDLASMEDPMLTLGLNAMGVEHSFPGIFANFHFLLEETESTKDVMMDLVMLYLFTALGAAGSLIDTFRKRTKETRHTL